MGLFDTINNGVRSAGGWVGDHLGAPTDASVQHRADPVANGPPAKQEEGLFSSIMHGIGDLGRGVQQEGLSGLLDPFGAVDRQRAQRDLASRFNVVAPGTPGAGDQNNVTQEQFRDLARQYSDIRMGRSDLKIGTDGMNDEQAEAFRNGTMNDIGSLMQTNSGRALLTDLGNARNDDGSHRSTTISRISDDDFRNDGGHGGGRPDGKNKKGFVEYRPGEVALPGNADARSDVALMHELSHASASIHNRFARGDVTAADGATPADIAGQVSRSEYQAAGMGTFANDPYSENTYRRDRAAIGASGSGTRTDQGHGDVGMGQRTTYLYDNAPAGGGGNLGGGGHHHHHHDDDD